MGLQLGRWFKYAQAKVDRAVRSGHQELDELEAERAAQVAERPWLASDAETPTFEEVEARIDAESGAPPDPSAAADAEAARLELDRRAEAAKERLEAMRRELDADGGDEPKA